MPVILVLLALAPMLLPEFRDPKLERYILWYRRHAALGLNVLDCGFCDFGAEDWVP